MRDLTSFSFNPNCHSMASNGVRSSQAIWMTRSRSSAGQSFHGREALSTGLVGIASRLLAAGLDFGASDMLMRHP